MDDGSISFHARTLFFTFRKKNQLISSPLILFFVFFCFVFFLVRMSKRKGPSSPDAFTQDTKSKSKKPTLDLDGVMDLGVMIPDSDTIDTSSTPGPFSSLPAFFTEPGNLAFMREYTPLIDGPVAVAHQSFPKLDSNAFRKDFHLLHASHAVFVGVQNVTMYAWWVPHKRMVWVTLYWLDYEVLGDALFTTQTFSKIVAAHQLSEEKLHPRILALYQARENDLVGWVADVKEKKREEDVFAMFETQALLRLERTAKSIGRNMVVMISDTTEPSLSWDTILHFNATHQTNPHESDGQALAGGIFLKHRRKMFTRLISAECDRPEFQPASSFVSIQELVFREERYQDTIRRKESGYVPMPEHVRQMAGRSLEDEEKKYEFFDVPCSCLLGIPVIYTSTEDPPRKIENRDWINQAASRHRRQDLKEASWTDLLKRFHAPAMRTRFATPSLLPDMIHSQLAPLLQHLRTLCGARLQSVAIPSSSLERFPYHTTYHVHLFHPSAWMAKKAGEAGILDGLFSTGVFPQYQIFHKGAKDYTIAELYEFKDFPTYRQTKIASFTQACFNEWVKSALEREQDLLLDLSLPMDRVSYRWFSTDHASSYLKETLNYPGWISTIVIPSLDNGGAVQKRVVLPAFPLEKKVSEHPFVTHAQVVIPRKYTVPTVRIHHGFGVFKDYDSKIAADAYVLPLAMAILERKHRGVDVNVIVRHVLYTIKTRLLEIVRGLQALKIKPQYKQAHLSLVPLFHPFSGCVYIHLPYQRQIYKDLIPKDIIFRNIDFVWCTPLERSRLEEEWDKLLYIMMGHALLNKHVFDFPEVKRTPQMMKTELDKKAIKIDGVNRYLNAMRRLVTFDKKVEREYKLTEFGTPMPLNVYSLSYDGCHLFADMRSTTSDAEGSDSEDETGRMICEYEPEPTCQSLTHLKYILHMMNRGPQVHELYKTERTICSTEDIMQYCYLDEHLMPLHEFHSLVDSESCSNGFTTRPSVLECDPEGALLADMRATLSLCMQLGVSDDTTTLGTLRMAEDSEHPVRRVFVREERGYHSIFYNDMSARINNILARMFEEVWRRHGVTNIEQDPDFTVNIIVPDEEDD